MKFRLHYTDSYGSVKTILCESNCFADAEKFGQTMFGKKFVKAEFVDPDDAPKKAQATENYMGTGYYYPLADPDTIDTD